MPFLLTPACADVAPMYRKTADVAVIPKRKKVAIIGFATNTIHLVPWDNPEFELWGLNQGHMNFQRRADRWFEMHLPQYTADVRDPDYLQFLTQCPIPIYMIEPYDEYPNSVRFPIEEAIRYGGRDYFTSSISFMLALAGLEGFSEVHIYGVNLAIGDEYFYEKPCAEWWIGRLEGSGVKVVIPMASALVKQAHRYGYSVDNRPGQMTKALLDARMRDYRSKAEQKLNEYHIMLGALREDEALLQVAEGLDRGADVVLMPPAVPPVPST